MNRTIKFRAWDGTEMRFSEEENCCSWDDIAFENKERIMQLTGLLDKNGKEIYEGDVVKYYDSTTMWLNREVIFDDGLFGLKTDSNTIPFYGSTPEEWEVIGNRFEHPHLLATPTP